MRNRAAETNSNTIVNFFEKKQPAFGLDISGESVKIFEFEENGKKRAVRCCAQGDVPKGAVINDAIADAKTFSYVLEQIIQKPKFGRLNTRYAVVNLPESKSFVRVIQIPRMSEAEAENAVPFEAESFIPLPIDQVYLDWQQLGPAGDNKMNVLIIASPREFVDAYLGVLDNCGIKPVALEVESQSCHRALIDPQKKETALIVDLSAARTSLIMVEEGNLQFTSTIPLAGNAFTESIAKNLGVAAAKAEIIKNKIGIANTAEYPNIKTALLPVLSSLCAEIRNILKFHDERSAKHASKIILAGGTARLKNLPDFLRMEFQDMPGLGIELANPWALVPSLAEPPLDLDDALGYTTAIGLAMRGIADNN